MSETEIIPDIDFSRMYFKRAFRKGDCIPKLPDGVFVIKTPEELEAVQKAVDAWKVDKK